MAKQSQLNILLQGVEAWNEWREQNPITIVVLREADLSRANLYGANLSGADLSGTTNLTQDQIEVAKGDEQTILPEHLKRPAAWSLSSNEQPNRNA
jgi:hypothetical protein